MDNQPDQTAPAQPPVQETPVEPAPVRNPSPTPPPAPTSDQAKSKRGISKLLILGIVIIFLIVLGLVEFLMLNKSSKTATPTPTPAQQAVQTETPTIAPTSSPSAGMTNFISSLGKFSLSYPSSWVEPSHKELCNADLFDRAIYLGPDDKSVLVCASSFGGQMFVSSLDGDKRSDYELNAGYNDIKKTAVTVDGNTGDRIEAIAGDPQGMGSLASGTKIVRYLFYVDGRTYIAQYIQAPSGNNSSKDVLSDFETMVNSIKFIQ